MIDDQPRHLLSPGMSVEPEVDVGSHPSPTVGDSAADRPAGPLVDPTATPTP